MDRSGSPNHRDRSTDPGRESSRRFRRCANSRGVATGGNLTASLPEITTMTFSIPGALRASFWSLIGRMWAEQSPTRPYVRQVVSLLQARLGPGEARVVDVGCGAGLYSIALAEAGFEVTGVDSAQGMLNQAQRAMALETHRALRFERGDLDTRLGCEDGAFDAAIAISVLQATRSPERASREVRRILKSGGLLVVLHFPRQDYQTQPLWRQIRYKVIALKRRSISNTILAAAKVIAEQAGGARYWSVDELHSLLVGQGFQIDSTISTNPIVVVARRH